MPLIPPAERQPGPPLKDGPWNHQIHFAVSEDGLKWTEPSERPVMRQASVPDLILLDRDLPKADGPGTRKGDLVIYTVDARAGRHPGAEETARLVSADDGKTWSQPKVITIDFKSERPRGRPVDPAVVQLEDGRLRLYFFLPGWERRDPPPHVPGMPEPVLPPPGKPAPAYPPDLPPRPEPVIPRSPEPFQFAGDPHCILSAVSDDGVSFTLEEGVRFEDNVITDPEVVRTGDQWLMFLSLGQRTLLARSADGLRFERDESFNLPGGGVPGAVVLPDGRVRIYQCSREGVSSVVFDPKNGAIEKDPGLRLKTAGDPAVCRLASGGYIGVFKRWVEPARPEPIRNTPGEPHESTVSQRSPQ
jgi:hypothetical protein